jgi:hypothetical protein
VNVKDRQLCYVLNPKWEEVTRNWRKLHDREFHDQWSSKKLLLNNRIKENKDAYRVMMEQPEGREHLEDTSIDGMEA